MTKLGVVVLAAQCFQRLGLSVMMSMFYQGGVHIMYIDCFLLPNVCAMHNPPPTLSASPLRRNPRNCTLPSSLKRPATLPHASSDR